MSEIWAQLAAAVVAGGGIAELFRYLRHRGDQELSERDGDRSDFEAFQRTWTAEMRRLHSEIAELRLVVMALSEELAARGVDPLAIRLQAMQPMLPVIPSTKDEEK